MRARNPADVTLELLDEIPGRASTADRYVAPDSHRRHGDYVKYVIERCRCGPCSAAATAYNQRRVADRRNGIEAYVHAGPARAHIRMLMRAGVGPKSIAHLAGVSHGAISKIVYGDYRGRGPSKRIRSATEAAILAVTLDHADGGQKIDAGPTLALLDNLVARGFTKTWIANQLGTQSLQIAKTGGKVRASTARKVAELHEKLRGVSSPPRRSRWDPPNPDVDELRRTA